MAGLGSSKLMPVSKAQQGSDGQMRAGAPAQTLSSIEPPLVQGLRSFGDLSHLPHIDHNFECHGEPAQQSCFSREGQDVRPLERIPSDAGREVAAATAQPCTPLHHPRHPEQSEGAKKAPKPKGGQRIKSESIKHNEQNDREIQMLASHLRSLILYHFGNSEALQVFALKRILGYLQQHPPIHICHVQRKNGDRRGMILLVKCLLCSPEAPSPFKEPNALAKFGHHFRTVHCGIKNPFGCVIPPCDKSFSLRHDMTRHVKTAHPEFDGTAGDIEQVIPASVVASNATGPSNTRRSSKGSSPVVARHHTSSLPSSITGPNRQMNPYTRQPIAPPPSWDWNTMNAGAGNVHGAGSSTGHQAGYMTSGNALWVNQSSSSRLTMPFHNTQGEPYGGLSHISASGANVSADHRHSHAQRTQPSPPSLLNRSRGGVPSGTHSQIQSRHPESSTVVAQMALPVTSNYPMNAMPWNQILQSRQNRMPPSVRGSRQPLPIQATAGADTQQWYDSNTRHAQALHHQVDDMNAGLAYPLGEPSYMQPGGQDISTSFQARHAGFTQQFQHQYPHPHPLQNRVEPTLNHNQHPPHLPRELSQIYSNLGSWAFTHPSLDTGYPGTNPGSQTDRTRTKPPQDIGTNVSLGIKTLKGGVERNLPSWLGLIGLMVGVSEAFLGAILVFLGPPRDRRGMQFLSLSRESEVHNRSQSGKWTLRRWRLCL